MHSLLDVIEYSKELNILYVEDDLNARRTTADMFETFFLSVDTAVDGLDGLKKYKNHKNETTQHYDLIITDINMPKKNGIEMIEDILKINPKQSIVVISAYNDSDRLLELIRIGVDNFITKPIMPNVLLQIISKVSKAIYNEKMKNEFLLGQSKLALMGEMIDTIAHQWLGPISIIKMQTQMVEMDIDNGEIKKDDLKECTTKQLIQIEHITQTLNEFRAFFRPADKLTVSTCQDLIDKTMILLKDRLIKATVTTELNIEKDLEIKVIPNEFKHVLINIITNAVDEFKNKNIKNPKIIINGYKKDENVIIEISDNAGGISEDIIDNIFDAHFTTKTQTDGTGVGLYLVFLILKKIKARIEVENIVDGAKFKIILK